MGLVSALAGSGAAGDATRRDLSGIARLCFWALAGLIVFGIVLTFVHIPDGSLVYSGLGQVIFARLTAFDFSGRAGRPTLTPRHFWPRRSFSAR